MQPSPASGSATPAPQRALLQRFPRIAETGWAALGDFPTPVEAFDDLAASIAPGIGGGALWIKRDDLSHALYGGNKVRTLEVLLGAAQRAGASRVYSTGAFGSNHAAAALLHAPRLGLKGGVVLYPQPYSSAAAENLELILTQRPDVVALPHWSLLPAGMLSAARRERRAGGAATVMVPGGATPVGALAYVSAALELAEQVQAGACPAPARVVVGVGSCCTSAGLLVGLRLAAKLGVGFTRPPLLVSVRVTPWPVTAARRVLDLARRTAALLLELTADERAGASIAELSSAFRLEPDFFGTGYGEATASGLAAMASWGAAGSGMTLDTTYSAKSAACVVRYLERRAPGPTLYWATKSSAPIPEADPQAIAAAPWLMRRWLRAARQA